VSHLDPGDGKANPGDHPAMNIEVRRLGRGDESILALLAADDADFDIDGRGEAAPPASPADAEAYLTDPSILHWVAQDGEQTLGFLHCQMIRKDGGSAREVLLYEMGVRAHARRHGVGRALVAAMSTWMKQEGITEVWVLADNPGATAFYEACGFEVEAHVPVYLTRTR
jgi:GNAT superfamily N-acetyltransferase